MRLSKHLRRVRALPKPIGKSVASLVVKRFTTLYGSPTTHDPEGFVHEYHQALNGTAPELLREAINVVVKRQTVPAWPPVGACVEAVHQAAERRAGERKRQERQEEADYRQPTPEERARVGALLAGLAGKLASRSGERALQPREDWSRASKPAWEERMATSETAQQLSIPRNGRRT
jgi:hypothetical protein